MRSVHLLAILALTQSVATASDLDELKVKRQEVFEFTEKPIVAREGDKVTVTFVSKAFCDATVAIEDAQGKIVRHLASGVLGDNAPSPFQKKTLKQTVVWDGKNDKGEYVDDKENCTIRVSLGLKPQFEKNLLWEPKRRITWRTLLMRAAPEGVYVFDSRGHDHLRLFDHQGNYVRTVYPFPAGQLDKVRGLDWVEFPQDGKRLPLALGPMRNTLLTAGEHRWQGELYWGAKEATGATAMDVRDGRIVLAMQRLNMLAADSRGPANPRSIGGDEVALFHGPHLATEPIAACSSPMPPMGES